MNTPLVSILVPCYNVEAYLPQCLDTILGQTYQNLQVVLIDDGSKDGTWNVMQEYAKKDARVEIYHQENQGVSPTRNHLLEKVKGEYVLFVDSDDWIELDMVEFLVYQIQENDADVVTCEMVKNDIPVSEQPAKNDIWNQDTLIREFLAHRIINGSLCNKLIKTCLLQVERIDIRCSYGEDALFFWHIIQNVKKFIQTDKQLYHYRMNDESISHSTYNSRKMSGHIVWETIAKEAKEWCPQYANIAEANYAISDMWQLYFARQSNYPRDKNIKLFQENVRSHLPMIYRSGLVNLKKMIFATVAAYCYYVCKIFIR